MTLRHSILARLLCYSSIACCFLCSTNRRTQFQETIKYTLLTSARRTITMNCNVLRMCWCTYVCVYVKYFCYALLCLSVNRLVFLVRQLIGTQIIYEFLDCFGILSLLHLAVYLHFGYSLSRSIAESISCAFFLLLLLLQKQVFYSYSILELLFVCRLSCVSFILFGVCFFFFHFPFIFFDNSLCA